MSAQLSPEFLEFERQQQQKLSSAGQAGAPSLSGPVPRYSAPTAQGMGGTAPQPARAAKPPPRELTPEEMMAMADQLEASFRARIAQREAPQVQPALERSGSVPYWLQQYAASEGIDKGVPGANGGGQRRP